jgi:hypothetical protein
MSILESCLVKWVTSGISSGSNKEEFISLIPVIVYVFKTIMPLNNEDLKPLAALLF